MTKPHFTPWRDFWRGSEAEWQAWYHRTEPTSPPADKRRGWVYLALMIVFWIGYAMGVITTLGGMWQS